MPSHAPLPSPSLNTNAAEISNAIDIEGIFPALTVKGELSSHLTCRNPSSSVKVPAVPVPPTAYTVFNPSPLPVPS